MRCTAAAGAGPALIALLVVAMPVLAQGWELRVCAGSSNLPYSNREQQGFENLIAQLLARELGAELTIIWLEVPDAQARQTLLQQGDCDVLMGTVEGQPGLLTTLAYYRSSYAFVYPSDAPYEIGSLDDEVLRELRIGVQAGAEGISPVTYSLARRDLIGNQVTFRLDYGEPDPLGEIVEAVAEGQVDVAIVWGPVAGYFASQQTAELEVTPVLPHIDMPFVPMVSSIAIGVRSGNEALRDDLNLALARRWGEIQQILRRFQVPFEALPVPRPGDSAN